MEYNDQGPGKCHQFNSHAFHSQINYFSLQTFCFLFELIKSWITLFSETNKLIISEADIINYDHQNINCFNVSTPLHKTVHLMFSEIMFFSEQNSLQLTLSLSYIDVVLSASFPFGFIIVIDSSLESCGLYLPVLLISDLLAVMGSAFISLSQPFRTLKASEWLAVVEPDLSLNNLAEMASIELCIRGCS